MWFKSCSVKNKQSENYFFIAKVEKKLVQYELQSVNFIPLQNAGHADTLKPRKLIPQKNKIKQVTEPKSAAITAKKSLSFDEPMLEPLKHIPAAQAEVI